MAILENFFSLLVMGIALLVGVPFFSAFLGFLLFLTAGIAYLIFRFRRTKPRTYVAVLRRAFLILAAVLAFCALPGFLFACRGRMNELCLFFAGPFLGGSVITLALALLCHVAEALRRPAPASSSSSPTNG